MNESGYQTLGEAQDALTDMLQRYRELETDLKGARIRLDQMQRNVTDKEESLLALSADIKEALALVATGFNMTVKEDPYG